MDLFGHGKEFWEVWGTFGDTIGGCANLITMLLAAVGFWWARNEVHRARSQHADELRAAAARDIYRAVHHMVTTLKQLRRVSGPGARAQTVDALKKELDDECFPTFRAAMADARLIFDGALVPLLEPMKDLAADTYNLTHWQDHTASSALDSRIAEFEKRAEETLRFYATLSMGAPNPPPLAKR